VRGVAINRGLCDQAEQRQWENLSANGLHFPPKRQIERHDQSG